jgi:hypothetical protein
VPDPVINYHHLVVMGLGLVGPYTKSVVMLLYEALSMEESSNIGNKIT